MRNSENSGIGCVGVVIIVLIVLWLTGYFNKPQQQPPAETAQSTEKQP